MHNKLEGYSKLAPPFSFTLTQKSALSTHPEISESSIKKKIFGNGIITIESFKKKKFEILRYMSSTYIGHLPC